MISAIALGMSLFMTQPVFCTETLAWDEGAQPEYYTVAVSFTGPDDKIYVYTMRTEEARCELLTPYDREITVTVGAVYHRPNGDVYTLTSEPFKFIGCASKKAKK